MRQIEFIETLGRGGFGAVYLADVHGRDDFVQRVAVKVLSADMTEHADIAARQRDEARLLARLNHDHIVRVIDLTEVDGRPAVLMEYVEGADAAVLLKRAPLPPRAAVQIAMAAASALDAAWSTVGRSGRPLRVIHRDIKPANLLVSRHGGVKVLDFGVARADFDREGRTGSVQFGTARFMAPEQWLYGEASHKVDVYALGVTLVELLSGMHLQRAPLQPEAFEAHMASVRAAVVQPDWPSTFAHGIDGLLGLMLAFTPEQRPEASECFEILAELADRAPGESLRRWAAQVVPAVVDEQRQRWAAEPPPPPGTLGDGPVPVAPEETASTARPTPTSTPEAALAPPPAVQEPADTLATPRPPPKAGRPWVPLAAAAAAVSVLAVGLAVVWPHLGAAPPEPQDTLDVGVPAQDAPAAEPAAEPAVEPAEALPQEPPEPAPAPPDPSPEAAPQAKATLPSAAVKTAGPATATAGQPASTPPLASTAAAEAPTATAAPASQQAPETAVAATTVPMSFSSTPWGAELRVDGQVMGTTPLRNLPLSVGSHEVTLTHGEHRTTRTITVGGRNPTIHTWHVETDQWRSSL